MGREYISKGRIRVIDLRERQPTRNSRRRGGQKRQREVEGQRTSSTIRVCVAMGASEAEVVTEPTSAVAESRGAASSSRGTESPSCRGCDSDMFAGARHGRSGIG